MYIEPAERELLYQELARLGQLLGVPVPQAFLELQVTMPDGRVVHHHKQRSHSWIRNAYNLLFMNLACVGHEDATFGAGLLSIKTVDAVVHSAVWAASIVAYWTGVGGNPQLTDMHGIIGIYAGYRAGATVTNAGIIVGSGTNAESFEDYALQTLIAEGNGSGQLNYTQQDDYTLSYVAGTKTLTVTMIRYMNNNSSGSVAVNEVGLAGQGLFGVINQSRSMLVSRDKLGSTVTVPAAGQLKTTYTISLVYPA